MARKAAARRIAVTSSVRRVTAMDRTIGVRLRARRLEQHMSQDDLGHELGVSFQQVQKYEKGVNRIGSSRLVEIARILQVDTAYFLSDPKGGTNGVMVSKFADFLATVDGVKINEAMMKLSEAHRREVIDLARVLVRAYGV
jgi:transcriptional regulator with XRE-family HTH domain